MKKMIALTFLISASLAHASSLEWVDIELYQPYVLNQKISFPEGVEFQAGGKVEVIDFIAGGVPVVYYQMHVEDCKNPEAKAEMILINPNPEDTTRDRSIAVALNEGCDLDVWVETQDLYSKSILDSAQESALNLRRH